MTNPILFCIPMLLVFSCKEKAGKTPGTNTTAPNIGVADTAVGIEGSEKAKFDGAAFTYAAAKVTVTNNGSGEMIEINGTKIPGQEDDFFSGIPSAYDFASMTVSATGDATCFSVQ